MTYKWIAVLTIAISLVLLFQPDSQAASTVYYVCDCQNGADGQCTPGNNGSSGTDPAAPWQTYDQARNHFNSSIQAGDEIRFCRGGSFDLGSGSGRWSTFSCTAAQPCLIADYTPPWASGDENRPILNRTADDHAFELSNGGDAVANGGYAFRNLDLRCPACTSGGGWGFFLFNDVNDVVIDNVSMDGFAIGIHLAGANPCAAGDPLCNGQNDRITVSNVDVTNSFSQGFLGSGNDLLIEDSIFDRNGSGTVFDHNIYVSGGSRITIRNNELYRSSLDGSGRCGGTSLVGHGYLTDLLIEGNYVHEDVGQANQTCWGISITTGYSTPEAFTNVTIRGNRVENVGNVAIGTSSCISCTIENNVVVHQQAFGVAGIAVPDKTPGAGDAVSTDVTIRNNSLALSSGRGIVLNAGSGHTIVSNALRLTGSDSGWHCLDATAGSYDVIDYNICQFSSGVWAAGASNLAAWQGQGWGSHSQAADPGFLSDTDLRPGSETAALVNAGHPTQSSPFDYDGRSRFPPPDAGAYEWLTLEKVWIPMIKR